METFSGHAGCQNVLSAIGKGVEFDRLESRIVIDRDNEDLVFAWSCEIEGAFSVLSAMAGDGYGSPMQWDALQIANEIRKFGDWLAF